MNHKRSLEGYFFRYCDTKPAKRIYSFRMWQPDRIPFVFKTGSQNKTKNKKKHYYSSLWCFLLQCIAYLSCSTDIRKNTYYTVSVAGNKNDAADSDVRRIP